MTENCALENPRREDCMEDVLGVKAGECFCEFECERRVRDLEVVEPEEDVYLEELYDPA